MKKHTVKIAAITMAGVMLSQVLTFGASANFKDVTTKYDWAAEAIDSLYDEGIVAGFEDGYFRPADTIRRCDFMIMLYKKFAEEGEYTSALPEDVEAGVYYDGAYMWAASAGIVDPSELFYPTEPITRQDAFYYLYKCLVDDGTITDENKSSDVSAFSDVSEVDKDKVEAIGTLIGLEIVHGYNGLIAPQSTMTRAEMAVVFFTASSAAKTVKNAQSIEVDATVDATIETADSKFIVSTSADTYYLVDGNEAEIEGENITVEEEGKSGIIIQNEANLEIRDAKISKAGDAKSSVNTGVSGVNSAVVARTGSTLSLLDSVIKTSGKYSNGISIYDGNNNVTIDGCEIVTNEVGSAPILINDNSTLTLTNSKLRVNADDTRAINAVGSGETITVKDCDISSYGEKAPAVTASGNFTIADTAIKSDKSVGIETLGDTTLNIENVEFDTEDSPVKITVTAREASKHTTANTTYIKNTDLTTKNGVPAIDVVNVNADVYLTGCVLSSTGILFRSKIDSSVNAYAKGAHTTITLDNQEGEGRVEATINAVLNLVLKNGSHLKTSLNPNQGGVVNVDLQSGDDVLELTGDCYVGYFLNHGDYGFNNIKDNGWHIYYDSNLDENDWLDDDTYSLPNGGEIEPR